MRSIIIFFILGLLTAPLFAADCEPGFQEPLFIRALDGASRPLEGAQVSLTYQIDKTTGKGYSTTKSFETPANGTVRIFVTNREISEDRVDCNILVNVTFDNKTVFRTIVAQRHPKIIDLALDAFILNVRVVDDRNQPIQEATVLVNEQEKKTDSRGVAEFKANKGNVRVFAGYGEGKTERTIDFKADTSVSLQIGRYDLHLETIDDSGTPVDAVATISAKDYPFSGQTDIAGIPVPNPTVFVTYAGITKEVSVDLVTTTEYTVVFDTTPPTISRVSEVDSNANRRFSVLASDTGPYATGVDPKSLVFRYSSDGRNWKNALTYVSRTNQLIAEVDPAFETFQFEAEIKDKDGNKQVIQGRVGTKEVPVANGSQNGSPSTNNSNVPQPPVQNQEFPLIPVVIGVAVLAIVIVAVIKLKKQGDEESG